MSENDPFGPSARDMVDALLDVEEPEDAPLTSWEIEFVDSIDRQMRSGKELSGKQLGILERIYEKL